MGIKLGANCRIYRNTATWGTPTWELMKRIKDVTLNIEPTETDVSTRDSIFELAAGAMIGASVDFQIQFDDEATAKSQRTALRTAALNRTPIELLVLDGAVDVVGSEGLRADWAVLKFTRNEALKEAVVYDVSIKPTLTDNAPTWFEVTS